MSERMLTYAEKRRIAAINKALIYGMDFCDEEEKRLIQSYIVMKTVRIDPRTEHNSTEFRSDLCQDCLQERSAPQRPARSQSAAGHRYLSWIHPHS